MSEQSRVKFERVICKNNSRNIKKNENGEYELSPIAYAYSGWQSATAEANKRMAELEGEVAELENSLQKIVEVLAAGADLNESYRKTIDAYEKAHKAALEEKNQARHDEALAYKHYHELQASNNDLREASQALIDRWDTPKWKDAEHTAIFINALRNALSATPAESLQAHDDEVLKRAAIAVKSWGYGCDGTVRALKSKME